MLTRYIFSRLLLMIPTLFGVMLVAFIITQFVPGGPVEQLISELKGQNKQGEASTGVEGLYRGATGLDAKRIAELKALYGFDKPAPERFFLMVQNYVFFELGESYFYHQSVIDLILAKLPVSLSIGLWTFFLTYLIAIPLGISKALHDGSAFDITTSTLILIGYATPSFVLGVFLLVLFGGGSFFNLFPLRGLISDHWDSLPLMAKITDYLWHLVLPITALLVTNLALMTFLTKNSFLAEIKQQYVITALANGLTPNAILYRHVFRNAIIPIATSFPTAFVTAFFSGSLLIETIFSLDGLGLLAYQSIIQRDYPVVLGSLYIFTLLSLFAKLLTDISYVLIDPRIQYGSINQ
ncbi:microcin C ABC transporter permease YejB [Beggiatoa leptomitoformis]|uniref:ABC transporter permease subunit n=1 Tax=Beggiatoa leptomitoformis TaxID=288004 RepID=A0A2N9YDI3_9GAMM|nr:ABC transporter permease subunit [Beggiatoa leptomitoformis]ALG69051.1 ABC transporter permease subunit [Beggiatoa leptomitoformis]AUI68540.1 ABC transporter permease subunit [Beggiatoa leptomitoformis]